MPFPTTLTPEEAREIVETRRDLHAHPELKYEERRTAGEVARRLRALDIEVREGVGKTGVIGLLRGAGAKGGKTVMLRADMDGLPIVEENDVPYASRNAGAMHACGHDGHTAILLAVAKQLARERERIRGTVKLVFQPAEEGGNGALKMIEEGALEDPKVDAAFGLHLWNNLPTGRIAACPGPIMAAVDEFTITVKGTGGHGAMPHQTVDPVVAASHVVIALQSIVSRNVNPLESAVVTVGSIQAGSAFNVISSEAVLRGTVRTFDRETYEAIPGHVERVASRVAEGLGAKAEIRYDRQCLATVNDPRMATFVSQVAAGVVGDENVLREGQRTMGGEDMSFFLAKVPGCFFFLGSRNEAKGFVHPHHSPRFDIDEDCLPIGVEILRRAALEFLHG
jgi:amidohydrolase